MKKPHHLLALFILLGFIFSSFMQSSPEKLIIGKWKLETIVSADSVQSPLGAAINKFLTGIIFEYKQDSSVALEFPEKEKEENTIKLTPTRYYFFTEKEKCFLVHVQNKFETNYEILTLNAETLSYKENNTTYLFTRFKK